MLEKVTSTQSNGELQSSLQAGVILPASEEKALVRKIDLQYVEEHTCTVI
jgi:hypothetical protein